MLHNHRAAGRANWLFTYTAAQVAWGARKQKEYRDSRLKIWKTKREEVMHEIRSKGLTVTDSAMESLLESMAGSYQISNAKSYRANNGPTIQVDDRLKDKLAECYSKVNEHETLSIQYDTWIQTLEAQPSLELDLTPEDFKFFFLNVGPIPGIPTMATPAPAPVPPAPAPAPTAGLGVAAPSVTLVAKETPQLKPSAPTLQQRAEGGSLSPFPAFMAPPAQGIQADVPATAVKTVFVPPDFEDGLPNVPPSALDEWPQD